LSKAFHGYIDKYQFFPKSSIYDEFNKERVSEFNRHSATLYFIVKTPKVKFIIDSFEIVDNFCIRGSFLIDDKTIDVIFNAAKIWFDAPVIKEKFKDIDKFTDYCMSQWGGPEIEGASNAEKYISSSEINLDKSNENYLRINCALSTALSNGKNKELILTPYQLINFFEMDCLGNLEIIYIGKSNDDTWRRIYNHNKWGLIEEFHESTDELLIYFMSLDKSYIENQQLDGLNVTHRNESELSIEDATNIMEASMIIHFMKEKKFNIELVGSNISTIKSVKEELLPNNYNKILVEVSLDGLFGYLGSPSIEASNNHKIEYEI